MENKELPTPENFEQLTELIQKIEETKQLTALKQIESIDKDNERQYQFAIQKEDNELKKWNKTFWAGAIATTILGLTSIYLLISNDDKSLGLGLLSTTFAGVFGFIAGAGSCDKKS